MLESGRKYATHRYTVIKWHMKGMTPTHTILGAPWENVPLGKLFKMLVIITFGKNLKFFNFPITDVWFPYTFWLYSVIFTATCIISNNVCSTSSCYFKNSCQSTLWRYLFPWWAPYHLTIWQVITIKYRMT